MRKILILLVLVLAVSLGTSSSAQPMETFSVGVFLPSADTNSINQFESLVGKHQDIIMYFQAWASNQGNLPFDPNQAQAIINRGSIPMVTWEPWQWGAGQTNQPNYRLSTITSGLHDNYIRTYARSIKSVNGTIYLRFGHEMNGNWYPWAGTVNGNKPADYVSAYRYVVDLFRQEGAHNVRWVWAPNNVGLPDWNTSSFSQYYPGDAYVDFAAIDGYNFGDSNNYSSWLSFKQIFSAAYQEITGLTNKPIIIAETASTEKGGEKSEWIRMAFERLPVDYPKVVALIWFNEDKETDWRINSSSASLNAYKTAMAKLAKTPVDIAPPKTTVTTLARVRALADNKRRVRVRWTAVDPLPSAGLAYYTVQYKIGNSTRWSYWHRQTGTTSGIFTGRGDRVYYLRARAMDLANNLGPWSAVKTLVVLPPL